MTYVLYGTISLAIGALINVTADLLPALTQRVVKIEETWPFLDLQVGRRRQRWLLVLFATIVMGIVLVVDSTAASHEENGALLAVALYLAIFLLIVVIDVEHRRVPNAIVVPALIVGLLLSFLFSSAPALPSLGSAIKGGFVGFLIFLMIARARPGAMGMGDVKLAGLIGVVVGFPAVLTALALGIIAGGVGALLLILARRTSLKGTMAYAPYLALGASVVLLEQAGVLAWWGERLQQWLL